MGNHVKKPEKRERKRRRQSSNSDVELLPPSTLSPEVATNIPEERKDTLKDDTPSEDKMDKILETLRNIGTKDELSEVLKTAVDGIREEVVALKAEFAGKIKAIEIKVKDLETENDELEARIEQIEQKCIERDCIIDNLQVSMIKALQASNANAQYSRRNNIRIFGMEKTENEDCVKAVCDLLNRNLNMSLVKEDIGAAHRLPRRSATVEPDPIIVRFNDRAKRDHVVRNRKTFVNKNIRIKDDLTQANSGLLNRAFNHEGIEYAYCYNGKIFAVSKDYYRFQIDILDNLNIKLAARTKGFKVTPNPGSKPVTKRPASTFTDMKLFQKDFPRI